VLHGVSRQVSMYVHRPSCYGFLLFVYFVVMKLHTLGTS